MFYSFSTKDPGRWHDAKVLRQSQLRQTFEVEGLRLFPGAVILGDSAYPNREWLIPPFPGDPPGARGLFNRAHKRTRSFVERQIGILKNRFYLLRTGIRMKKAEDASKLIQVCVGLNNLCIRLGDDGDDFSEDGEEEGGNDDELDEVEAATGPPR